MVAEADIFGRNPPMPNHRSKCRIYLNQPLDAGHKADIPADQAHYLRQVMRLASGDPITLFNGEGGEYEGSIVQLTKQGGCCHIESFNDVNRETAIRVHIIQCANKSEKIETVLQKCTELGAASFQVADSERAQFKLPANKLESRLSRWQRIIIEAAEQSERTIVPDICREPALKNIDIRGKAFALHPEGATSWKAVRDDITSYEEITLAIGPEGGFSPRDLETLKAKGFESLAFGPRVMRTETAAPALLAAIQAVL